MELEYRQFAPGPALSASVRCLWALRGPGRDGAGLTPQPIIPDGCVEIVFNLGDPFRRVGADGALVEQPTQLLVGQVTGPTVVAPSGAVDLVGVRFHPWGAGALLPMPVGELRNEIVPLEGVARRLAADVPSLLHERPDLDDRAAELAAVLASLAAERGPSDPIPRAAVEYVARSPAVPSVRALAAHLGRSVRTIQRTFDEAIGLTPKMLLRITRMQRAIRLARLAPHRSWSAIAAEVGYFDQPHLVRDFRSLAGCAPSDLRSGDGAITASFLE